MRTVRPAPTSIITWAPRGSATKAKAWPSVARALAAGRAPSTRNRASLGRNPVTNASEQAQSPVRRVRRDPAPIHRYIGRRNPGLDGAGCGGIDRRFPCRAGFAPAGGESRAGIMDP